MNSTNFKWNILAVLAITLALFVVFGQSTSITNVIKAGGGGSDSYRQDVAPCSRSVCPASGSCELASGHLIFC